MAQVRRWRRLRLTTALLTCAGVVCACRPAAPRAAVVAPPSPRPIGEARSGGAPVAQPRTVRGLLLDSLLTNDVLRGALLAIDGRTGVVNTSDAGAFSFDSVVPGRHRLQVWHPLLDSLGVDDLHIDFAVPDGDAVATATLPTPQSLVLERCGPAKGRAFDGMLVGIVRRTATDAPLGDVEVAAAWRGPDTTYLGSGLRERARTRSSARGQFVICRVPRFTPVELFARTARTETPRVRLQLGAALLGAFDLSVDGVVVSDTGSLPVARIGSITGRVLMSTGEGLPNVSVQLDRPSVRATTDADGRFTFSQADAGVRALEIRAIGFKPSRVGINLRPGQRVERNITIDRNAALLGTVTVRATRPATWDSVGFSERRRRGGGYFFTRENLRGITDLSTALRMVPGISGRSSEQSARLTAGRGAGCFPAYIVNGVRFGANQSIGPDTFVRADDVRAIEVYTSKLTTPPEYQRYLDCAVIVIWLRDRQGEIEAAARRNKE